MKFIGGTDHQAPIDAWPLAIPLDRTVLLIQVLSIASVGRDERLKEQEVEGRKRIFF